MLRIQYRSLNYLIRQPSKVFFDKKAGFATHFDAIEELELDGPGSRPKFIRDSTYSGSLKIGPAKPCAISTKTSTSVRSESSSSELEETRVLKYWTSRLASNQNGFVISSSKDKLWRNPEWDWD